MQPQANRCMTSFRCATPDFRLRLGAFGEVYAAFFEESRRFQVCVAGSPVSRSKNISRRVVGGEREPQIPRLRSG
jgi:hypothetical protein